MNRLKSVLFGASRRGTAGRFALLASIAAAACLPLFPEGYLYDNDALDRLEAMDQYPWRVMLVIPLAAVTAFMTAFAWSDPVGRLGAWRGVLCALLTYVGVAMVLSWIGWHVSNEWIPFFRIAMAALVTMPVLWLLLVLGAAGGAVFGARRDPARAAGVRSQDRVLRALSLAVPILAFIAAQHTPELRSARHHMTQAHALSDHLHDSFERGEFEAFHDALSIEADAAVDRDELLRKLAAIRAHVGAPSTAGNRRVRPRYMPQSQLIKISSARNGEGANSSGTLLFTIEHGTVRLHGIFMRADGMAPAQNVYTPRRICSPGRPPLLHCASFYELPPQPIL